MLQRIIWNELAKIISDLKKYTNRQINSMSLGMESQQSLNDPGKWM